ncbi:uncharacterized protein LOC127746695 [Arachis duranensis]|uniref:Uncharacterized protein LOC127746695 n=1 Tax=Arachis duranensis TaxID=130453 RepID=A0A9C6WTC0_ARADU|nr:uncharacterized protein LOC127746695 [Arachis duranensis]
MEDAEVRADEAVIIKSVSRARNPSWSASQDGRPGLMKFGVKGRHRVDHRLWKIILEGPQFPTTTSAEGVVSLKPEASWTEEDKKKVELNAKAVNLLNCVISFEEYRRVSRCTTAKRIRDKLQITHVGTTLVKKTRIDMLNKVYEMFSMKEAELIDEMFERFNIIIIGLDAMKITYPDSVLVRRVLRCLTKE